MEPIYLCKYVGRIIFILKIKNLIITIKYAYSNVTPAAWERLQHSFFQPCDYLRGIHAMALYPTWFRTSEHRNKITHAVMSLIEHEFHQA